MAREGAGTAAELWQELWDRDRHPDPEEREPGTRREQEEQERRDDRQGEQRAEVRERQESRR